MAGHGETSIRYLRLIAGCARSKITDCLESMQAKMDYSTIRFTGRSLLRKTTQNNTAQNNRPERTGTTLLDQAGVALFGC